MTSYLVRHRYGKGSGRGICIRPSDAVDELLLNCQPGDTIHKVLAELILISRHSELFAELDAQLQRGDYVRV